MTAWTPDEDGRLLSAYQEVGRQHDDPVQWAEIAALVGGDRSQKACRNRYNRLVVVPATEEKPVEKPVEKPATKQKEQEPPPAAADEDEDEDDLLTHGAWERPKRSGGRISGPLAALAPDAHVRLVWQAWRDEKLLSRPSYAKMMKAVWWCDEDGTSHSECARGSVACRSPPAPRALLRTRSHHSHRSAPCRQRAAQFS